MRVHLRYPISDQNGQNLYPIPDQNGPETIPFGAAHNYTACIILEGSVKMWIVK